MMNQPPNDVSFVELEALAREYLYVGGQIEALRDRQEVVAEQLRDLGLGTHRCGAVSVGVQRNRRLSMKKIQVAYPVASFPHLYKAALNVGALRKHVAEADLQGFYVDGVPRVVVRGE